ncbi:MAG: serine/threonine protein kinase [Myxococcales bacterium]|nr:serine/threonine protein kinase [Myxococcales bacterium]
MRLPRSLGSGAELFVARVLDRGPSVRPGRPWRIDLEISWEGSRPDERLFDDLASELHRLHDAHAVIAEIRSHSLRLVHYGAAADQLPDLVQRASSANPDCVIRWSAIRDDGWSSVAQLMSAHSAAWSAEARLDEAVLMTDRYALQGTIDYPPPGLVHRGLDRGTKRIVALWTHPAAVGRPALIDHLRRAALDAVRVDSPNVLKTLDFGVLPSGTPFAASELPLGRTLRYAIEAGDLSFAVRVGIAGRVARGLASAHELGVVHGNLAPELIVLEPAPRSTVVPKVVGLGVARPDWIGSPAPDLSMAMYSAPECGLGGTAAVASDIYSLAMIVFELVTGRHPFGDAVSPLEVVRRKAAGVWTPASQLMPGIPESLEEIFDRALRPHPIDRYESMRALAADLERVASHSSPPETPRAMSRRAPTPPDVPAVGPADENTLVARIPRTMLVEDLIVRLRATNSLVHQEIGRALRETIMAEHEGESVDGRAATEQAAKLFLDALEITLQSRLASLRHRFERELLEELEAHVRERPREHTALRLQRFLTAGGDASVRLIGEWMSLEPRFGEVVRAAAEVPAERVRDVIEAGAMRNVLAHLAEYKSGKRRRLGGAERWFRVEPRDEGSRDVVLRLEALRWLEDLVCQVAEGERDTLVAKRPTPPG